MKHLNLTIGLIAINQLQLNHVISSSKLLLLHRSSGQEEGGSQGGCSSGGMKDFNLAI
jgi:hypothetical protein